MAQYRSQWTGEVVDTAVGNAKDLAFVEIGVDAAGALEKCKKAFGVSALYGIGDYDPLVYLSANLYHCISGGIYGGHEYWFAHLRGTRLRLYKLYEVDNVAYWEGPIITDYAEADDVNARLRGADAAFNCRYDTSSYNIEAGQYVFWKKYLWIATTNIAVGDTLASTGANKNLERVSTNGGLNDLKSALNAVEDDIAIRVVGNKTTYASGAAIGQYVIVSGSTITGITDGMYKAAKAIPYNTVIDSTYLTAVSGGGINDLKAAIDNAAARIPSIACVKKGSGGTKTITIGIDSAVLSQGQVYIAFFGRAGYSGSVVAMGAINVSTDGASVLNLGQETISASISGNTLTITTAQTYANLTFISNTNIW